MCTLCNLFHMQEGDTGKNSIYIKNLIPKREITRIYDLITVKTSDAIIHQYS